MNKISITKVFIDVGVNERCILELDQDRHGEEIFALSLSDGREIFLYENEIVAAHQMLQKLKELNSKD